MASDLYQVWTSGSIKFYDFLAVLSRTQNETHRVFIFLKLYFLLVLLNIQKTFLYFDQFCENTILKLSEFGIQIKRMDIAFLPFFKFYEKMNWLRLINAFDKVSPKIGWN